MLSLSNELFAVILYLFVLVGVGALSYRKQMSAADYIIGDRSLNPWLTALAAHASDMSSWLFMGYPAKVYLSGFSGTWVGLGLIFFMYLNWKLVAPRIRVATEQFNSLTFSSFFESRLGDTSGLIRIFTALMALIFYTFYIAAGLVSLGIVIETMFQIPYWIGILTGILIIVPYVFIGGYTTLAWIDLFQGFFLLFMIIFVPLVALPKIGYFSGIVAEAKSLNISFSLLPDYTPYSLWKALLLFCSLGLGYFGQPHIVTKFMGIQKPSHIKQSTWIGMTWMLFSLGAATLVGLVAIPFFKGSIADPEQVFITMVRDLFSPFLVGLILCAVLAATINAVSSQLLVLTSSLTEDLYKRIFKQHASEEELLKISRLGVVLAGTIAYLIAIPRTQGVYELVLIAFSGLGASFGPLILCSLYSKWLNRYGAWAGILVGGITSVFWPHVDSALILNPRFHYYQDTVPPIFVGFIASLLVIYIVSKLTGGEKAVVANKKNT